MNDLYAVTGVSLLVAQASYGHGSPLAAAAKAIKAAAASPVRLSATPSPAKAEVEGLVKIGTQTYWPTD